MSRPHQPNRDDYPRAALKHLEDAEALLKAHRYDGAGYHAGYVVECALKTLLLYARGRVVR
ncbi:MAG: HEPN domain-containing protein, partial [Anaerolineae bacterium]|nr:HEPN domain-containing protein [Anaerolineae bacterium]